MGLFDLFKKKETKKDTVRNSGALIEDNFTIHINSEQTVTSDEDLEDFEHLTPEGDLPWGWFTHNKEFVDKMEAEHSYFLHKWIDARNKSPKELYSALKSFVSYLDDLQKLCKQKGECFVFWFDNIIASPEYIEKRKNELQYLIDNFEKIQHDHDRKTAWLSVLDNEIIKNLQENDGILQSDFIKLFDETVHADVSSKLYHMAKSGEIERIKSGRSYILHYTKNKGVLQL